MNAHRFKLACESVIHAEREQNGIGTLGEKTLHAVLKHYYEPDEANHEIKIGSFVADIVTNSSQAPAVGEIIEIQTRSFDKLRKKLLEFLEIGPVIVVYPIPKTKWLLWIDEETGEITKKRKSPKQGQIYDVILELYKIKPFLIHPNFRLCIVLIDLEEYRYLNGWSKDKKKGSTRCDRVPIDIVEEVYINSIADYMKFIPKGLNHQFTSKDYRDAAKTSLRTSQTALNILHYIGVVKRVGKQGRLYLNECVHVKS